MSDDRGVPRHLVYGLGLADGNVMPGFPIDVAVELAARPSNFNAVAQNQRGALKLLQRVDADDLDLGGVTALPLTLPGSPTR